MIAGGGKREFRLRLSRHTVAAAFRGFRQHAGTAAARGRCLLCGPAKRHALRRRTRGAASGVCRTHLEQAVLLSGRAALAQRRSRPADAAGLALARPQCRLAKLKQCRHSFDARQLGVSLVRLLGSGISLHPVRADRCGVREAPTGAAHARMVHAPQRPNSRLRVGIQRRKSPGACLGDLARVSNRPQTKCAAKAIWSFSSACFTSSC